MSRIVSTLVAVVVKFLARRGVTLSQENTRITHITEFSPQNDYFIDNFFQIINLRQ